MYVITDQHGAEYVRMFDARVYWTKEVSEAKRFKSRAVAMRFVRAIWPKTPRLFPVVQIGKRP